MSRGAAATVRDTGAGSCVVRIEADRSADRRTIAGEGAAVTALGFVVVLVGAVAAAPAVLLAAPVAVVAGVGVASTGVAAGPGRIEHDVQLVLEAVDQGDRPARLPTGVMRARAESGDMIVSAAGGAPRRGGARSC